MKTALKMAVCGSSVPSLMSRALAQVLKLLATLACCYSHPDDRYAEAGRVILVNRIRQRKPRNFGGTQNCWTT